MVGRLVWRLTHSRVPAEQSDHAVSMQLRDGYSPPLHDTVLDLTAFFISEWIIHGGLFLFIQRGLLHVRVVQVDRGIMLDRKGVRNSHDEDGLRK